jgi:hypothetical protein
MVVGVTLMFGVLVSTIHFPGMDVRVTEAGTVNVLPATSVIVPDKLPVLRSKVSCPAWTVYSKFITLPDTLL